MKKEKPPGYYDDLFSKQPDYQVGYRQSYYYVHWTQVIRFLEWFKDAEILEIGCGTGQLAEYIYAEGFRKYRGFDFSPKAIETAKKKIPSFSFYTADALNPESYNSDYDLVICLEVLEHIKEDNRVLKNIRNGTTIIFSVPDFGGPSHVRWFRTERSLKARYYKLIDLKKIIKVGQIYICLGVKDPFKPTLLQRFFKTREKAGLGSFIKRIDFRINNLLKLK